MVSGSSIESRKIGVSVADIKALAAATRSSRFMDDISVEGKYISLEYSIIINDDLYANPLCEIISRKYVSRVPHNLCPLNSLVSYFKNQIERENHTSNGVYY